MPGLDEHEIAPLQPPRRREIYRRPTRSATIHWPPRRPAAPLRFHQSLPGYAPTPLVELPEIAAAFNVRHVLAKVEASRFGLPAFKILGASWAAYRGLAEHLHLPDQPWTSIEDFAKQLTSHRRLILAAATDGNHGRAVARMARLFGLSAQIFVPSGTASSRVEAIQSEGAECTIVQGSYGAALERSRLSLSPHCLVITDVGWPGYHRIPELAIEGYSTIFRETEQQLASAGLPAIDLIACPVGGGGLAASTLRFYRHRDARNPPRILGVEAISAACVLESLRAGKIVTTPGPHTSIMAGLNCDAPSEAAWPLLSRGIDCQIAIEDEPAIQAMRDLAGAGLATGETGSAALAGLTELLSGPDANAYRESLGLTAGSTVLLLCTEGVTDPAAYADLVPQARH